MQRAHTNPPLSQAPWHCREGNFAGRGGPRRNRCSAGRHSQESRTHRIRLADSADQHQTLNSCSGDPNQIFGFVQNNSVALVSAAWQGLAPRAQYAGPPSLLTLAASSEETLGVDRDQVVGVDLPQALRCPADPRRQCLAGWVALVPGLVDKGPRQNGWVIPGLTNKSRETRLMGARTQRWLVLRSVVCS